VLVLGVVAVGVITVSVLTQSLAFGLDLVVSRISYLMVGVLALILIGVILGLAWVVKAVLGGRRKNLRNVQSNETETQ
jgi:hypothetical protein